LLDDPASELRREAVRVSDRAVRQAADTLRRRSRDLSAGPWLAREADQTEAIRR
jgi:hypothetical protein